MKSCLVIIPTYNERDNIAPLVAEIFQNIPQAKVLIVDDNSPDGTGVICDQLAKTNRRVQVLHRAAKMGLGTAYREGFKIALSRGMEYIIEMDADFSHDPVVLKKMLAEIPDHGVVIGSRFCNGVSVVNWPIRRLILSLLASYYVRKITGLKISDTTTGYKCFKREVLEKIDLDRVISEDYAFQIEMNYLTMKLGYTIQEIPIIFVDRHSGTSKMSTGIINEALILPWKLRLRSLFGRLPFKKNQP